MGKSRKFVIATALVASTVGAIFVGGSVLNRHRVQPTPAPGASTTPPPLPASSPGDEGGIIAAAGSGGDASNSDPAPDATANPANAQDAEPDYRYRGATEPVSSEVPPDAGNEWQRAFEKEQRDEAWARPLEMEIQKSLEPEINLGRFYIGNVECRATLCEIRLLARGSLQRDELDQFQTQIHQLPWAGGLNAALSSGIASRDGYESIWIFEKKPGTASGVR